MDERTRPVRTAPLRFLASVNESVLPEATSPDFTFKYVDISQVDGNGEISIPDDPIKFGAAPSRARRVAEPGSTVVSTVRTYLRAIAAVPTVDDQLVFSTGFAVLRPLQGEPRYFSYACRSDVFVNEIVARSVGVSYPAISPSELMDIRLPSPDITEQRRIADFLDDCVARIDQIVAARHIQRRLLAQATSSRLQELQDAWTQSCGETRLGRVLLDLEQGWSPQAESTPAEPGEWGVMRSGCVNDGVFREHDNKRLPETLDPQKEYELRPGDLLVSRASGSLDKIGSAAVVPSGVRERLLLCDKIYRLTPLPGWDPHFIAPMLRTHRNRELIRLGVSGAEGMANNLPSGVIRGLMVPLAPQTQQASFSQTLANLEKQSRLADDALIQSVNLLQEYKQSLITAAVTGELDVTTAGSGIPG